MTRPHIAVFRTKSGLRAMMISEIRSKRLTAGRKRYECYFGDEKVVIHYQAGISPMTAKATAIDQLGPLFGI